MDLIQHLVSQLGVNEDQAKGGAGLLLKMAKEQLGGNFDQIATAIPNVGEMIEAAPESESGGGLMGAVGGLASKFGVGGGLGDLAQLAGGFDKLGLDTDMLTKFIPSVLEFIEEHAGPQVKQLLEGLLKK